MTTSLPTLFIAGAGFMGHGIAQAAASANCIVYLYDLKEELAAKGIERIAQSLEKLKVKFPDSVGDPAHILSRLYPTASLDDASNASLVIEAIAENFALKADLFSRLDKVSPKETVFCSNTSAIPISQLAAATTRPDRFCGMHFFSPVVLMKLVEVVRGIGTSDETVLRVMNLARKLGKEPVEVKRDIAGFIVNRILIAAILEAVRVVESGTAEAPAIDHAMRLGCGHKMGPLETADMAGLDVVFNAANAIYEDTGDVKYKPPTLLARLVAAGHYGRKSGRGFYDYAGKASR